MNLIVNFILGLVLGKIVFCLLSVLIFVFIIGYFATAFGIDIPFLSQFTQYVISLFEPIKSFITQFIK